MFQSVLVANRGEIAARIIRSAKELGLHTIAVYSELDRDALHVTLADEAWSIGPAPASQSYLDMDRIIEVAKESKAEAIHPGYGFLAENPAFAQKVLDAKLVWVGPKPETMRIMGDKIASRNAVAKVGVEAVPGNLEAVNSPEEVLEIASRLGYPVAIKAAHGGGGKGLRLVANDDEALEAFEGARREAEAYFGNPEVYIEKFIERPRHIEAQVVFDSHGKGVFMGERDCSVQRRHQKLIEETPAMGLSPKKREELAQAAIKVGKACDYVGVGTVEFLFDPEGHFYFLEMNTRLQVEHTVTEVVTGIDLVRTQFEIAAGMDLDFDEVQPRGHAIEFRINAEDPYQSFLPTPGRVTEYSEPAGYGVRVDGWIQAGSSISQYYDNLLAKLIVWGRTRDEAVARGLRALNEFKISGISTTIPAHQLVLQHQDFLSANHHTKWMESIEFVRTEPEVGPTLPEEEALERRSMTVEVGGRRFEVAYWTPPAAPAVTGKPRRRAPKLEKSRGFTNADGVIPAPMQGTIVKVKVKPGDRVKAGDSICILEAMKMENDIKAPADGEVIDLRVQSGDTVAVGDPLAIVR